MDSSKSLDYEQQSYSPWMKFFHWFMGICILMVLNIGFLLDDIPTLQKHFWISFHKSLGVLALITLFFRIGIKIQSKKLKPVQPRILHILSSATVIFLYAAMLIVPLSGYLMSLLQGYPVSFFNLFNLPALLVKDKEMGNLFFDIHAWAATFFAYFIGLHIMGALYHKFFLKDDVLNRMLPKLKFWTRKNLEENGEGD